MVILTSFPPFLDDDDSPCENTEIVIPNVPRFFCVVLSVASLSAAGYGSPVSVLFIIIICVHFCAQTRYRVFVTCLNSDIFY